MKQLVINATMLQFLPHLQAVKVDETQVIFSRTNNIGYIENGILFVRPEYLPGGAKNNVFVDQDLKTLKEALKLSEVITEEAFKVRKEKRENVRGLLNNIKLSTDLAKIEQLALEAATAGEGITDQEITNMLNEIVNLVAQKQNEEKEKELANLEEKKPEDKKHEDKKSEEKKPADDKKKTTKKLPKAAKKKSAKKKKGKGK